MNTGDQPTTPGWYDDPDGMPGSQAYWDGEMWTARRRPQTPQKQPLWRITGLFGIAGIAFGTSILIGTSDMDWTQTSPLVPFLGGASVFLGTLALIFTVFAFFEETPGHGQRTESAKRARPPRLREALAIAFFVLVVLLLVLCVRLDEDLRLGQLVTLAWPRPTRSWLGAVAGLPETEKRAARPAT